MVTVEFYGVPRLRAGRAELAVEAARACDVLAAVRSACPRLHDLIAADGRLAPHYLLSIDGGEFFRDLSRALPEGTHLLLLSADAGG